MTPHTEPHAHDAAADRDAHDAAADRHIHGSDDDLLDWDRRGDDLERGGELDLDWAEDALGWVVSLVGDVRDAMDLGSGPGVAAVALAERCPGATVTAVDGSRPLLDRAAARAARAGVASQLRTLEHDLGGDLADLPEVGLVWVSRVLHHLPDPAAAVGALRRRLRPGGLLAAVEGGLPVRWAPEDLSLGRPGLQARLDVAVSTALQELTSAHGIRPGTDWAGLFRAAGYRDVRTRSWLHDVPAPVPAAVRARIRDQLTMVRDRFGAELDPADRDAVDRLLDPAEPLGIDHRPDLFWLTAHTVYVGRA